MKLTRKKLPGPWRITIWQLPDTNWHWEVYHYETWSDMDVKIRHRDAKLWSGKAASKEEANENALASLDKIKQLEQELRNIEVLKNSTTKTLKLR
jgi:hypothetical protein